MKLSEILDIESDQEVVNAANAISKAIVSVDESMHYETFAKAVALTLKQDYGQHLFRKFMSTLYQELTSKD